MQFTDNQKKALDLRRHLAITANAGAGKTAVLVERYVSILSRTGAEVRDVVALTYTEKAASELRTKIARLLDDKMRGAPTAAARSVFERIRDQLPSATIGTIHSFCAQLLREFPLEADIDAGFGIIEDVERTSLLEQVLAESIAAVASGRRGEPLRDQLFTLVRTLGRKRTEAYLAAMLDKREQLDRLTGDGGMLREPIDTSAVLGRWDDAFAEAIVGAFGSVPWEAPLRALLPDGEAADEVRGLLAGLGRASAGEQARLLALIYAKVFTKGGGPRRRLFRKALDDGAMAVHAAALGRLQRAAGALVAAAGTDGGSAASARMLELSRLLLNVYEACHAEYAARKADLGKLDFDDLQLKVRDLLRQPEIRERIAGRYAYLLVDEFQDTNTLQYEIIFKLLRDLACGNLFVVGDPKQSIYGFRNAEVEVFQMSCSRIAHEASDPRPFSWGESELASTDDERRGTILLAESFRPLPALAAAVNALFRRIFAAEESPFGVDYTDLATGRTGGKGGGAVELLLARAPEAGDVTTAELVREEARGVARRIAALRASGTPVASRNGLPFSYGDCAVLLRRRANIRELELAFAAYGIPYHLSGGVGFYQTQEVFDLYSLFRFLLSRDDDIALAGVLRSPLAGVSDAELFEISRERGGSFWEKTLRFTEGGRGSEPLRFGVRLLQELQLQAARIPAPQLVHKVLTATGWTGAAASSAAGEQRVANVRKLIRLLRDFEEAGRVSLFDIVERLKALVEEHEKEGQATLDQAGDAVRIMTVHAAKGLEFPVVVLPFLHERFRYDASLLIDPSLGLGFEAEGESPALQLLRYRNRSKTEAEERRIFYVACTRAQDLLVLSANGEARSGQESRYKWLLAGLGIAPHEIRPGRVELEPERLVTVTPGENGFVRRETEIVPAIDILEAGAVRADLAGEMPPGDRESHEPELLTEPLPAVPSRDMLSATHFRTYLECPTKFFLKYVVGLPEHAGSSRDVDVEDDPDDGIAGGLEGSLAHKVLQGLAGREQMEDKIGSVLAAEPWLSAEDRDSLAGSLAALLGGCLASEFYREISGSKERRTEYALGMLFDGGYLSGTIDCLYRSTEGEWALVDYKSDAIPRGETAARAASHKAQIAFYAFLVSRYFRQTAVRASILFLRHPDAPVHFRFGAEELEAIGSDIRKTMASLRRGDYRRTARLCSSCTYREGEDCLIRFRDQ